MTSATGGALLPSSTPAPLEGEALLVFIQNWIAPLVAPLPSNMVRPRWQPEPSNIPNAGDAWVAIGLVPDRAADTFPYREQSADGLTSTLKRNEELPILCSFYDVGSTGLADKYASLLRDNLAFEQNWEALLSQNMKLGWVGTLTPAPTMKNTRWLYRMDLPLMVRRQIDRKYEVLSVKTMQGTVHTSDGYDFPISAADDSEE